MHPAARRPRRPRAVTRFCVLRSHGQHHPHVRHALHGLTAKAGAGPRGGMAAPPLSVCLPACLPVCVRARVCVSAHTAEQLLFLLQPPIQLECPGDKHTASRHSAAGPAHTSTHGGRRVVRRRRASSCDLGALEWVQLWWSRWTSVLVSPAGVGVGTGPGQRRSDPTPQPRGGRRRRRPAPRRRAAAAATATAAGVMPVPDVSPRGGAHTSRTPPAPRYLRWRRRRRAARGGADTARAATTAGARLRRRGLSVPSGGRRWR
jgi:hypothetical protein